MLENCSVSLNLNFYWSENLPAKILVAVNFGKSLIRHSKAVEFVFMNDLIKLVTRPNLMCSGGKIISSFLTSGVLTTLSWPTTMFSRMGQSLLWYWFHVFTNWEYQKAAKSKKTLLCKFNQGTRI